MHSTSLPEVADAAACSAAADALSADLAQALEQGDLDVLAPQSLQRLMAALCRTFVARVEQGEDLLPVVARSGVSDTEAMTMASHFLKANNLQVFELGLWMSWSGR